MNTNLSRHERIHNVAAGQMVEELKARHAYLHGINYGREEYGVFWLRSTDTTWGHCFGRMIGYDEMFKAHCGISADEMFGSARFAKWFGDEMNGHDKRSTYFCLCHVLASPVIEVADDGASARSWYLTPGTMMSTMDFSDENSDGSHRSGFWLWERYGSDFVYKDGKWWWAHEQVCPDLMGDYDAENWAQIQYAEDKKTNGEVGPNGGGPRQLTDARDAHMYWTTLQPVQYTVVPPVPYETLDENNTFSPGYNKFDVILPATRSYGGDVI